MAKQKSHFSVQKNAFFDKTGKHLKQKNHFSAQKNAFFDKKGNPYTEKCFFVQKSDFCVKNGFPAKK